MAVHGSTVCSWVKEILKETEIDVDIFKGHPARSAPTSKACLSGISADDILSGGSWSNKIQLAKILSYKSAFKGAVFPGRGTRTVW